MTTSVVSMPRESSREIADSLATECPPPQSERASPSNRSIVVIGHDPLMVRALDRLLRKAGYEVGVRERDLDQPNDPLQLDDPSVPALTIVDVPDAWTRQGPRPSVTPRRRPERPDSILWLSNTTSIVDSTEQCLVKPFTASQFLAKVESLLCQNVNTR